eukprot:58397-Chlamydomonas_euryale.AAC.1
MPTLIPTRMPVPTPILMRMSMPTAIPMRMPMPTLIPMRTPAPPPDADDCGARGAGGGGREGSAARKGARS